MPLLRRGHQETVGGLQMGGASNPAIFACGDVASALPALPN